jgi:chaperone modulatory protein CbpM
MTDADLPALLSDQLEIALEDLARASGLSPDEIVELVEFGVFEPRGPAPGQWRFSAQHIVVARRARRLRADFDLNLPGVMLALTYLERIEALERELHHLRCQLLG